MRMPPLLTRTAVSPPAVWLAAMISLLMLPAAADGQHVGGMDLMDGQEIGFAEVEQGARRDRNHDVVSLDDAKVAVHCFRGMEELRGVHRRQHPERHRGPERASAPHRPARGRG